MVFRSHELKKNLYYKEVKNENKKEYVVGIKRLQADGWKVKAIVCDGKPGLFNCFGDIPIQMCHFHQKQIILRYITRNPILEANKELKDIVLDLGKWRKDNYLMRLKDWYNRHEGFLKEISINPITNQKRYTHSRTKSAYRSMIKNYKYLFTYKDYEGEIDIPNTTNGLEGIFSHLKDKVRLHRGLKQERKLKLIFELLSK